MSGGGLSGCCLNFLVSSSKYFGHWSCDVQRDTDSDRDILYTECQCLVIINKSSSICKAGDLLVLFVGSSGLTRILSSIYPAHYPAADGGRDLDALLLHLLLIGSYCAFASLVWWWGSKKLQHTQIIISIDGFRGRSAVEKRWLGRTPTNLQRVSLFC